jgi:hypothetical protein
VKNITHIDAGKGRGKPGICPLLDFEKGNQFKIVCSRY